jgi:Flp pilus assembly protein TadG
MDLAVPSTEPLKSRPRRRGRGQALVEFALVLPVFLLIMLGVVDFGRAVYGFNTIGNAARVGGRVAIVSQTTATIQTAAMTEAIGLGTQASDVVVSYGCTAPYSIGCIASVTVNYTFHPITPIIGAIWQTINMSSTTQLPIEHVGP